MKAELDHDWNKYKSASREGGLSEWVERFKFENKCRDILGVKVRIEWQEDGGVTAAGVIAFSLT